MPEPERIIEALTRLIGAVERADELLENSAAVWDAYEQARIVLGDPVQTYPGGYEDHHIHPFGWNEAEGCDACEDYAADRDPAPVA